MSREILEAYLIGWVIRDPSTILELVPVLAAASFQVYPYDVMAKHLFRMHLAGESITYASLATAMWNDGVTDMNVLIKIHDADRDAPADIFVQPILDELLTTTR